MRETYRSRCPISLALDVFGDRWTLLIIRDLMFARKRHFREFLQSEEAISSNILADRLSMLVEQRIVTKSDDPSHKQKAVYSLTEMGIALLPILAQIGIWSRKFRPVTKQSSATAASLETGGRALWEKLTEQLSEKHLSARRHRQRARANARRSA